jgi:hypothetical protein
MLAIFNVDNFHTCFQNIFCISTFTHKIKNKHIALNIIKKFYFQRNIFFVNNFFHKISRKIYKSEKNNLEDENNIVIKKKKMYICNI